MSLLDSGIDFSFRGALVDIYALFGLRFGLVFGAVGDEGTLDFVWMEESRRFAVALVELILVGICSNT